MWKECSEISAKGTRTIVCLSLLCKPCRKPRRLSYVKVQDRARVQFSFTDFGARNMKPATFVIGT